MIKYLLAYYFLSYMTNIPPSNSYVREWIVFDAVITIQKQKWQRNTNILISLTVLLQYTWHILRTWKTLRGGGGQYVVTIPLKNAPYFLETVSIVTVQNLQYFVYIHFTLDQITVI